jgi:hypothetical protein
MELPERQYKCAESGVPFSPRPVWTYTLRPGAVNELIAWAATAGQYFAGMAGGLPNVAFSPLVEGGAADKSVRPT